MTKKTEPSSKQPPKKQPQPRPRVRTAVRAGGGITAMDDWEAPVS